MPVLEETMRDVFLWLAKSRQANTWARRYGLRLGAQNFVAGETIESAIEAVRALHRAGMAATLDHLGEFVTTEPEARASADFCIRTLEAIHASAVDSSLSLKLTQIGLDIDKSLCLENMRNILAYANARDLWVNIDMEDYTHCEDTLDVFRKSFNDYDKVQTVIQAYLYRSLADVTALAKMGASIRIVKGAYKEPPSVAYPDKKDVDDNYVAMMEVHLKSRGLTSIATHDDRIIEHAKRFIADNHIPKDQYEFQMLYGIRGDLQASLAQEGHPVRIYIPYGDDWYGYFMRRLAERPANVSFVLRGMFR